MPNPFTLPGPLFLLLFSLLALCALLACKLRVRRFGRSHDFDVTHLTQDPYRAAYLRDGESEVIRVALFNLVDRGLLRHDAFALAPAGKVEGRAVRRELDHAILTLAKARPDISTVLRDPQVRSVAGRYGDELAREGLVAPPSEMAARRRFGHAVSALLVALAATKGVYALHTGRGDVIFLVVAATIAVALVMMTVGHHGTPTGASALRTVQDLLRRLRKGSTRLKAGGATNEALLLAAVFGIAALPAALFPHAHEMFPRHPVSGSAGSDSGCGDGDGGGCGGCGGCGGG